MSNLYSINELEAMGITIYGKNIKITKFVNIYNGKNLILHDNIRIDDFTIISCKGTIEIFNNVSVYKVYIGIKNLEIYILFQIYFN